MGKKYNYLAIGMLTYLVGQNGILSIEATPNKQHTNVTDYLVTKQPNHRKAKPYTVRVLGENPNVVVG